MIGNSAAAKGHDPLNSLNSFKIKSINNSSNHKYIDNVMHHQIQPFIEDPDSSTRNIVFD